MKRILVFMIFMIAWALLFAKCARGQQQVGTRDGLPSELPIGSEQRMMDWVTTNQPIWVHIFMLYTGTDDSVYQMWQTYSGQRFSSRHEFDTCVYTNGLRMLASLKQQTNVASDISFEVVTTHFKQVSVDSFDLDIGFISSRVDTSLGPVSSITSNSFLNLPLLYIRTGVWTSNVCNFAISVDSTPAYTNCWDAESETCIYPSPAGQPEQTKEAGVVVFNNWYASGVNRARFTISTTDGKSKSYTQAGDELFSPNTHILSPSLIKAIVPRGSDVTLFSSNDNLTWREIAIVSSLSNTNGTVFFPIIANLTQEFFRVGVR